MLFVDNNLGTKWRTSGSAVLTIIEIQFGYHMRHASVLQDPLAAWTTPDGRAGCKQSKHFYACTTRNEKWRQVVCIITGTGTTK
jgi:hypothetical protein